MKSIAIANCKGGTGKSLSTFTLAGFLAKKRKKVLVVDCDAQGNTSNNFCVSEMVSEYNLPTVSDIYENNILPTNVVIKSPLSNIPYLDVIPSNISLTATEMRLVSYPARETLLKSYIEKHKSFFDNYDYIFFDLNPSINIINQTVLYFVDSIIMVSDVDINSFNGVVLLKNLWEDISFKLGIDSKIKGLIINRFDKRIKLSKDFIEYLREHEELQKLSFDTLIPENVKLKESVTVGEPICYYDTKSSGYLAFTKLLKEMKERGVI